MPIQKFHRQVAGIALTAAARHGFALGGGNALIAHGIVDRLTEDVDLFTDRDDGVALAADAVESALLAAGLQADRQDKTGGLADLFEGMGDQMAEWIVSEPDGGQMTLQMAYIDRCCKPVRMDVGPVLDLDDVVGSKVCALASRVATRDYVDTAAALRRYSVEQLIGLAHRLDPGLTGRDFADAGDRLDSMADDVFARYGLSQQDVAELRRQFAGWPRA
jgi:hypothetical protein